MLRKHTVNIHVQGTSAGVIVGGGNKLHIATAFDELGDNGVVGFVAAQSIPGHADDAGKMTVVEILDQVIELWPRNPVLHFTGFGEREFRVFFEAGMRLTHQATGAEAVEDDRRDRELVIFSKPNTRSFLMI